MCLQMTRRAPERSRAGLLPNANRSIPLPACRWASPGVGAKTLFTARDHPDLQTEPSADAPHG